MVKNVIISVCCVIALLFVLDKCVKPPKGKVLRYENFRGYRIPILADGKGGSHPWYADVPWAKFTINEKLSMAMQGGGKLNKDELEEIRQLYGVN